MSNQQSDVEVSDAPTRKAAKVEKTPLRNPNTMYCSFYVSRKHRFCRTECKAGSLYCCTHHIDAAETESMINQDGTSTLDSSSAAPGDTNSSGEARVPCPINPNHTVYASRLEKHVRVCPDLRFVTTQLPYFRENKHANKGADFVKQRPAEDRDRSAARRTHRDLSQEDLARLMRKVSECYCACVEPEIVILPSCDTATSAEAPRESVGAPPTGAAETSSTPLSHGESTSQKHGPQHAALLRCLGDLVLQSRSAESILTLYTKLQPRINLLDGADTGSIHVDGFLEFGAGKGGLSVALQQLILHHLSISEPGADKNEGAATLEAAADESSSARTSSCSFLHEVAARPPLVVLDMDGFRRKGDARVRHSAVPLRRLRINIKDVDLTQAFLTDIRPSVSANPVTGEAAVADEMRSGASSRDVVKPPVQNWAVLGKHLCGACTDFALSCLTEAPSLSDAAQVQLPIVVIATCCHHRCEMTHLNPPEMQSADNVETPVVLSMPGSAFTWSEEEFAALASMSSWAVSGDFVDEERRLAGWQCKRVIDQLRVHFLRQLGYVAFQCQYTTRDVTEENICIVAFRR